MAERIREPVGPGRLFAIVLGIVYLAVAVAEVTLGVNDRQLLMGDYVLLQNAPVQNAIHWVAAIVVLASFFGGEYAAKVMARLTGMFFLVVSVVGVAARAYAGELAGFDGSLPWSYNLLHLATAAAALIAGFMAPRTGAATAPTPTQPPG